MKNRKEYTAQLQQMYENAQRWRKEHSDKIVLISWNFHDKVAIIAPISQAIDCGFVRTNPEGLELLKALWSWDDENEPTVLMCLAVLELEDAVQRKKN